VHLLGTLRASCVARRGSVKGVKTLIRGSWRSGRVVTWRLSRAGSPPLCLFSRGLARRYVLMVHARARIPKAAGGRKNRFGKSV
jgi:hypothetical protein